MSKAGEPQKEPWITLGEVWLAYRKAKKEAYYNSTAAYGLKFVNFERDLVGNLAKVHQTLLDVNHAWASEPAFLGGTSLVPKSIQAYSDGEAEPHFIESDPLAEWRRTHNRSRRAAASVRLVITASVEYLVISTLWSLKVGEKYERALITPGVYANRLRRRYRRGKDDQQYEVGPVNWDAHSIYQSFHYQYRRWRSDGLRASRADLEEGHRVVGISLDVVSFYDSIDADFLLSKAFMKRMGVKLTAEERDFTQAMITSFRSWYLQAGLERGIPIGLPSSGLIANLLLGPFDQKLLDQLKPTFYGRFVDDIYLSLKTAEEFKDGRSLLKWLVHQIPWLSLLQDELRVQLPYSKGSQIRLGSSKQRVFMLEGEPGKDVLATIEEHMRAQASAHRMLPTLPESDTELKDRALLLNRDAGLATAVFREADFVKLRKAGLSEELSKLERISDVLDKAEWEDVRKSFYDLMARHILAPSGFFEFYAYLPRVVGLMAANGDWQELTSFLENMVKLRTLLGDTTTLADDQLKEIFANLAKRTELAALKCCLGIDLPLLTEATEAIKKIRNVGEIDITGVTSLRIKQYAERLYLADWSRQPFYSRFLSGRVRQGTPIPIPKGVTSAIRLHDLQQALFNMRVSKLSTRNWRGLVFPTRSMPLSEITCKLDWRQIVGYRRRGKGFVGRSQFSKWVLALRGIRLNNWVTPKPILASGIGGIGLSVGSAKPRPIRVAVTNLLTEESEWKAAAGHKPSLSRARLTRLTRLVNRVLDHDPRPDVLVMPELSLPRSLMSFFVQRLGRSGIGLIAGLEYDSQSQKLPGLLNQAIITIDLGNGYGQLQVLQSKNAPAWDEAANLRDDFREHLIAPSRIPEIPVYRSLGFCFGVLICSDLTDPRNRLHFQGRVDGLYVIEWNKDINSFNSLVEASALDVHCYMIQANNRLYGDGRIRGPMKEPFARDVIQLKGGVHDYFVVGEIDPEALRLFQSADPPDLKKDALFKPYPIGFKIAYWRKLKP